jgi:phage FluMu protein Com
VAGQERRCEHCGAVLLKVVQVWFLELLKSLRIPVIEIKCRRCKTINKI